MVGKGCHNPRGMFALFRPASQLAKRSARSGVTRITDFVLYSIVCLSFERVMALFSVMKFSQRTRHPTNNVRCIVILQRQILLLECIQSIQCSIFGTDCFTELKVVRCSHYLFLHFALQRLHKRERRRHLGPARSSRPRHRSAP